MDEEWNGAGGSMNCVAWSTVLARIEAEQQTINSEDEEHDG